MSSTKMIREIPVKLPSHQVWDKLADIGNICHGHSAVSKSFITSDLKTGGWRNPPLRLHHAGRQRRRKGDQMGRGKSPLATRLVPLSRRHGNGSVERLRWGWRRDSGHN